MLLRYCYYFSASMMELQETGFRMFQMSRLMSGMRLKMMLGVHFVLASADCLFRESG